MNTITTFVPSDIISLNHGQPMTTSLKVAEVFGKLHKNVLRKLEALECSQEFRRLNFEPTVYHRQNPSGGDPIPTPIWNMTKDGFMFLVMGFTGKQAATIKEAYINAFNWMAERLSQQPRGGIRIPAPNGPDNTFCGRLLVSVEYDQITGCRPLPDDAFIATPANLVSRLRESPSISTEQLREVAELCLLHLTERASLSTHPSHSPRRLAL